MRPLPARILMLGVVLLLAARCAGLDPTAASDVPLSSSAAAEGCAAKLPPAASVIYKDARLDVHAETNMESLLRVKVMMLIVTDRIKRSEARPAAERAVECLELLQK